MKMTRTLSVVISVFNEEKKIQDCLESIKDLADEIIFVDNTSTDKTVEMAKKYTSKIFVRPNNPMLNINKNFGFLKATGDWILSLDADERVTSELVLEIKNQIANIKDEKIFGFWIPRKNIIFGKWIEHTGWYPDYQLRLFKNGKGMFPEKHVHEMIRVDGETLYLSNPMVHYNYDTIDQFLEKMIRIYTTNEAEELIRKGYQFKWQDAISFPLKEFLSRFFAREGYKDGFHGLMLSMLMAFYHFVIFARVWEKQGFGEVKEINILYGTEQELRNGYRQILYWIFHEKAKAAKSPLKKVLLKMKHRIS